MASNDMNSWDDNPDERLRRHWQQTFANFKVQASPSLSSRVLSALPVGRRRRRAYRGVVLLGLLSVGLLYPLRIGEGPYLRGNVATVGRAMPNQPLPDSHIRPFETPGGWSIPPRLPVSDSRPGESVVHRQPAVNPPTGTGVAVSRGAGSFGSLTTRKPLSTDQVRLRSRPGLRLRATAIPVGRPRAAAVRSVGIRLSVQWAGLGATGRSGPVSAQVERSGRATGSRLSGPQSSVVPPPANARPVVWARLKPVRILSLSSQLSVRPVQRPIIDIMPSHPVEAVAARRHQHWFMEVVPLSSYQWIRVPPVATAYLSQVRGPAALSPATWGYQINGGVRWQHWQAHLSLGQVRRWAYYTVNENRYRVEPRPDNPNQLVRETYAVAENVSLPMIGTGLSQETLLGRDRYAVDLGGQATYLPTSRQAMIGLWGGVGRRLTVSRALECQVGVRAEYGLNRLLSERQQIVIHPLLIGIGLRIQPRSYP